jgi:hypothetical protein
VSGTVIKGRVIFSFFFGRSRFQTGLRCFAQGTTSAHSLASPSVSVGASHGPPGPYTVKGWEKVDPLLPGCGLTGFHSAVYNQVAPSQEFWEPSRVNWGNFHLRHTTSLSKLHTSSPITSFEPESSPRRTDHSALRITFIHS